MEIKKSSLSNGQLTINVSGRLDTNSAPECSKFFSESIEGVTDLTIDFDGLEYISSAGLRVILSTQKIMDVQGKMKVIHVAPIVMEVLDITGFTDILTIE
ncbi:STAS domain-containing protein [Fibrobacter sp.]|uniref:STAS domain-containing protein n=1 Tax=Fibrobacter sp. TaxID=35828 RepID=UPI00388EDADC